MLLSHSVRSSRIQSFDVLFSLRMFQIYNEQSGTYYIPKELRFLQRTYNGLSF